MTKSKAEFVAWLANRAPALEFIRGSIRGGLSDYDNPEYYSPEAKRDHTRAVTAMCRNCHIVGRARRAAQEIEGVSIQTKLKNQRISFLIDSEVEVWYKAINRRGQANMRWSQQNFDYKSQIQESVTEPEEAQKPGSQIAQATLAMQMPPNVTRVIVGHKPLATSGGMQFELVVVCPPESGSPWEVRLSEGDVAELIIAPEEAEEQISKRVRRRSDA